MQCHSSRCRCEESEDQYTQLEEKALASRALYEHARALGKDFDSQCVEVRMNHR